MYSIKIEKKKKQKTDDFRHFYMTAVLVGAEGCGKTSLLKRLKSGTFENEHNFSLCAEETTLEAVLKIPYAEPIEVPKAAVAITEIRASDRFASILESMTKDVPIVLLMYDCQLHDGLENLLAVQKNIDTKDRWRHVMFVLIASKADKGIQPKVDFGTAKSIAHERGWLFFKTSAKDDTVEDLSGKLSGIATAALERWWQEEPEKLWAPFVENPLFIYKYIS